MHQQEAALENIVGKGEIARYEQFLLFPQSSLLNQIIASPFIHNFCIISLFASEFGEPKIGISGKGLRDAVMLLDPCCSRPDQLHQSSHKLLKPYKTGCTYSLKN